MDHVVYLDGKARELENLKSSVKSMIIRGAMGRKMPYGRIQKGDALYFVENNGKRMVSAKAHIHEFIETSALNSTESKNVVEHHMDALKLNTDMYKRFAGKRYLVLISLSNFETIEPFEIDRSEYKNMDDWLPVENINKVRVKTR